jgi:hypothetical protein
LAPLIALMPFGGLAARGAIALFAVLALGVVGVMLVRKCERRVFAGLLIMPLTIVVIVSFGRRLTGIEEFVGSVGKYNNVAFLWFSLAAFYLATCTIRNAPAGWKAGTAVAVVLVLFARYVAQDFTVLTDGERRRQQMQELVTIFKAYTERTAAASAPVHIPTLDGEYIAERFDMLFKYNLAHYRPFFGSYDQRLILLRTAAMDSWGSQATQTVRSLRQTVDPAFVHALQNDPALQSLYCGGVNLRTKPYGEARRGNPLPLDRTNISGATSISDDNATLSFSTSGSASSLRLVDDAWDPETAHVLSFKISTRNVAIDPKEDGVPIEISFSGDLSIPYAHNTIVLHKTDNDISIDLLQLYSYALNPAVRGLVLHFPHAGDYAISDVRFGH